MVHTVYVCFGNFASKTLTIQKYEKTFLFLSHAPGSASGHGAAPGGTPASAVLFCICVWQDRHGLRVRHQGHPHEPGQRGEFRTAPCHGPWQPGRLPQHDKERGCGGARPHGPHRFRLLPSGTWCHAPRQRLFPLVLLAVLGQLRDRLALSWLSPQCPAAGHLYRWLGQRDWHAGRHALGERPLGACPLPSEGTDGRTLPRRQARRQGHGTGHACHSLHRRSYLQLDRTLPLLGRHQLEEYLGDRLPRL